MWEKWKIGGCILLNFCKSIVFTIVIFATCHTNPTSWSSFTEISVKAWLDWKFCWCFASLSHFFVSQECTAKKDGLKKIKDSKVMGINHAVKNYWSIWDAGDYSVLCFLDSAAFQHLQNFFPVHFPKEDIKKLFHSFSCHKPSGQIYGNTF